MPEEQHHHTPYAARPHAPGHMSDVRPAHHVAPAPQPVHHAQVHQPAAHHTPAVHHTPPPSPPEPKSTLPNPSILQPTPVVKMWSTRGLEYAMMAISLWISALALGWLIIELINDRNSFVALVSPVSALVVCVPVLTFFFIRLKAEESKNPLLRADPSRRRWTQLTQFLAYIVVLLGLIGLVRTLLARYGADTTYGRSFGKTVLDSVTAIIVPLIILVYYWADEHRPIKR